MPEQKHSLSNRVIYGFLIAILLLIGLVLTSVESVRANGKANDKALIELKGKVGFQKETLDEIKPVVKQNELAIVEIKTRLTGIENRLSDIHGALMIWAENKKELSP